MHFCSREGSNPVLHRSNAMHPSASPQVIVIIFSLVAGQASAIDSELLLLSFSCVMVSLTLLSDPSRQPLGDQSSSIREASHSFIEALRSKRQLAVEEMEAVAQIEVLAGSLVDS